MRRKNAPISEANYIELGPQRKTVAMRCHVNIKGQQVIAVLDSGAAVSIITAKLMRKLGLRIDRDSKTIVVTANGAREKALGTIINVKITLQNIAIPIDLQVIESKDETLLLGTDWFTKARANLDFDNYTLKIRYLEKWATIYTTHVSGEPVPEEFEEFTDEDEWIDEIEDDETETYYTEEGDLENVDPFYNSWTVYIAVKN